MAAQYHLLNIPEKGVGLHYSAFWPFSGSHVLTFP